jgi:hypothetical protein
MPDSIGDQMAGVGPEATRVFGRNAQADIPRRMVERVKSTLRDVRPNATAVDYHLTRGHLVSSWQSQRPHFRCET